MRRSTSFLTISAALVALALVVGVSTWTSLGMAREAMVREVQRSERIAATERAAEAAAVLQHAGPVVEAFAHRPTLVRAIHDGDVTALQAEVDAVVRGRSVVGASIANADGIVLATATAPKGDDRITSLDTPFPGGGVLHVDLSVRVLLPLITTAVEGFESTVSLVDQDGSVIATNAKLDAATLRTARIRAPEVLALLGTGGIANYHSAVMDGDRVAAVAPVEGTSWSILVGAPVAGAGDAAAGLVRRQSIVVAVAAVAGLLVLVGLGVSLGRARRRLLDDGRSAELLAMTDSVTGLGNRRRLEQAFAQLTGTQRAASLAILDLDRFKALNDEHGHAAGDDALRRVGAALAATIRAGDVLVRWGGDEFAVLLAGDAGMSTAAAERLRTAVSSVEMPGYGPMRASIGLAVGPADLEELFARADRALYDAKRTARDHLPR
jgi:diguanylate cyclase (GGDEF)-like protein